MTLNVRTAFPLDQSWLTRPDSPMKTDWWVMASPTTPGISHHAFRCKGQ